MSYFLGMRSNKSSGSDIDQFGKPHKTRSVSHYANFVPPTYFEIGVQDISTFGNPGSSTFVRTLGTIHLLSVSGDSVLYVVR